MVSKVDGLLKTIGIPTELNFRPSFTSNVNQVISYHFFNEGALKYGDGEIKAKGGSLQVDLFVKHRTNYLNTKDSIVNVLTQNGFKLVDIDTSGEEIEGIGKIDHIIFRFNYKEDKHNGNDY